MNTSIENKINRFLLDNNFIIIKDMIDLLYVFKADLIMDIKEELETIRKEISSMKDSMDNCCKETEKSMVVNRKEQEKCLSD